MVVRRSLFGVGVLLIGASVWAALDQPTPTAPDEYGFVGNPCDGTVVQAFGGRDDHLDPPTDSRVCTDPARTQLGAAIALLVLGSVALGVRHKLARSTAALGEGVAR